MYRILVLSGVPGVGKSRIAARLALELDTHWYAQAEIIRQIMRLYDHDPILHKAALDSWELIGQGSSENLIAGFAAHVARVQPGVQECILSAYKRGATLIIEGVAINPRQMQALPMDVQRQTMMALLVCSDYDGHKSRVDQKIGRIPNGSLSMWLQNNFDKARILQEYLATEYQRLGLAVIENIDMEVTVRQIVSMFHRNHDEA